MQKIFEKTLAAGMLSGKVNARSPVKEVSVDLKVR